MKTSVAAMMVLSIGASTAALAVNVERDRETDSHTAHTVVTTCTLKRCPSSSSPLHGSNNHTGGSNGHNSNNHSSGSSGSHGNSGGSHDDKPGSGTSNVIYVAPRPLAAPEVDPATAFAGLTLLAGALAVARGRKSRS